VNNKESKFLFNIPIDTKSALPVYEQVKRAVKLAILAGQLKNGDRLMSLRELALKLHINPNTIIKVYYQLEVEGFITSQAGTGYFVQFDNKQVKKKKHDLFKQMTSEYISKVAKLGYSPLEIAEEISNLTNKESSKQNRGNKK
jgi:GntR family transcriptional regulator